MGHTLSAMGVEALGYRQPLGGARCTRGST
jgi:hypothetical protein